MRLAYLVCYDISDPKRLRVVYRTMRGFGVHLQFSVFRCELSDAERVTLIARLEPIIKHNEDQVLIVHLGPPTGRHASTMETIGLPLAHTPRGAVVI
jgi:CRISPR-associated protein Cas2